MNVKLGKLAKKIVEKKIKAGEYEKPEDVVMAALARLDQSPEFNFAPGELDALIAEGEASLKKYGSVDGRTFFAERKRRRSKLRKAS